MLTQAGVTASLLIHTSTTYGIISSFQSLFGFVKTISAKEALERFFHKDFGIIPFLY